MKREVILNPVILLQKRPDQYINSLIAEFKTVLPETHPTFHNMERPLRSASTEM